ncbi:trehalase-like isoform X1 [Rhopalosiphum maidis]|uniref:trehalase-like isoform X1 n=1 Tax=Rhopalosiphum maidis TaxID=43146 RepID=UPI000EFF03B5|nr:trehalase-like isoform X1 [Rhopalosiphum maidis]
MYRCTYSTYLLIMFLDGCLSAQNLLRSPFHSPPIYDICPSLIYCQGEFLRTIQLSKVFGSSKIFVDLKMKKLEKRIFTNFCKLNISFNGEIPLSELNKFVTNNFQQHTFDNWLIPDFRNHPTIIEYVQDYTYKEFLSGINQLWNKLAKKISLDVKINQDLYSMIYVPNGFFVNMESQNEFNYWDAYWIIKGALICGMETTVKGILQNFLYIIQNYGYVLMGNRIYYVGRSQPPLLIQMMATYYTYTKDEKFITDNIGLLDSEMMFWLKYRTVKVKSIGNTYIMTHYMSDTFDPRPEMYSNDVHIAKSLPTTQDQDEYLRRVKAASESGWGFSSKHFHNRNHYNDFRKTLLKTNPLNFAYVELNSIMQSNSNILSNMYLIANDQVNSDFYKQLAYRYQVGINALLWNEDEKIWLDFDTTIAESRNYFYASNLAPLWTGSYDDKLSEFYGDSAVEYLIRNNIINEDLTPRYICVPTSLYNTGLDWDYFNCWPQLQSMIIFGLRSTKSEKAQKVAFNLASSWVYTNFAGYNMTRTLFEKYSAIKLGSDGEQKPRENYPIGYGVTIGVLFEIFHEWGDKLKN